MNTVPNIEVVTNTDLIRSCNACGKQAYTWNDAAAPSEKAQPNGVRLFDLRICPNGVQTMVTKLCDECRLGVAKALMGFVPVGYRCVDCGRMEAESNQPCTEHGDVEMVYRLAKEPAEEHTTPAEARG